MDPDHLHDLFARFGAVSLRKMFGAHGIFADGLMFGLVEDGEIFLKVNNETQDAFASAGSRPFTYVAKGKTIEIAYWRLPDKAVDDPDEAARWARLAREAALRAQSRSATKKRGKALSTAK